MASIRDEFMNIKEDMIEFLQSLIQTKSYTGSEGNILKIIKAKMIELGYETILETQYGDIVGVIGDGPVKILFDSHVDTVEVTDEKDWKFPPFGGEIHDERIHGRGTVDMKSAIAATLYAGYIAKKLGLTQGKTIYVSTSIMEEDFDGFALGNIFDEFELKPNYVVICEPSENKIALGHRGRAMLQIDTHGVSAHGSAPENGINAIYLMNKVVARVEELNERLYDCDGAHGSVVVSKIESVAVSLNAVPEKCSIYLDRRLAKGESYDVIAKEMDAIVDSINATWSVYVATGVSPTKKEVNMKSFMSAWEADESSRFPQTMAQAYEAQTGKGATFMKWNFSTNGFASTARNIPTIGIGPGEIKYCHMRDENCRLQDVYDACVIYTDFISKI